MTTSRPHQTVKSQVGFLRRRPGRSVAILTATAAIVALGTTASLADIPDSGTVNGCYGKASGKLRVIDKSAGKNCSRLENPISWGQQGPKGEDGEDGTAATISSGIFQSPIVDSSNKTATAGVTCPIDDIPTGTGYFIFNNVGAKVERINSVPASNGWEVTVIMDADGFAVQTQVVCLSVS